MPPAHHTPLPSRRSSPTRLQMLQMLRQVDLFRHLEADDLAAVASVVRPTTYPQGAIIAEIGTPYSPLYLLTAGLALLCGVSPDGQQVALEVLQAGDLFGIDGVDGLTGAPVLQIVEKGTVLATVERFTPRRLMASYPDLAEALLEQSGRQLMRVHQRILELSACSVRVRLAHLLAQIRSDERVGGLSRDVLGLMVGASRRQVTRALDSLRAESLVAYQRHGREIVLCDRGRLASLEDPPQRNAKV